AAIDMIAGPSELLVLADATARAEFIAADLLSQAEHDPDAQVVLVTTDARLAETIVSLIPSYAQSLPRRAIIERSLAHSFVVVANSMEDAIAFANQYAPEHLSIQVANEDAVLQHISHAGSVFVGPCAPVAAGDYASGTNHTLPTAGTARFYSGVSIDSFQKSITFQRLSREGLVRLAPTLKTLAAAEGLEAHKRAVEIRERS
ncbi:MAG: histidinol dehydrogenase, partial [Ignavibacteriales bacterium]|nr:histidinol dehydrogenase [Ignavibacteriales bacterium]